MGDLFWNKVAGVIIGGILIVLVVKELGHLLVPSHGAHELTEDNTSYPVDWAALGGHGAEVAVEEETGPVDYGVLLANASLSAGERITRRCQSCHTFDNGGANGTGPNLWDIVDRDIAGIAGANYSGVLQEMAGNWTYEALDGFLESPRNFAPGTAMSFAGLRNQEDRINLIAYLRSLSDNPAVLPDPLAAAMEDVMEEAADAAEGAIMDDAMTDDGMMDEAMPEDGEAEAPAEDDGDH